MRAATHNDRHNLFKLTDALLSMQKRWLHSGKSDELIQALDNVLHALITLFVLIKKMDTPPTRNITNGTAKDASPAASAAWRSQSRVWPAPETDEARHTPEARRIAEGAGTASRMQEL